MKVKALHKNARMAPRKMRPLARLLTGMPVSTAATQLQFTPGKAPEILNGVLKSAAANAINNHNLAEDSLKISEIRIDEGIVMKRWNPVSKGMAHPILKRMSHVLVVLDGEEAEKKDTKKKKAVKKVETVSADEYMKQEDTVKAEEEKEAKKEVEEKEKRDTSTKAPKDEERSVETMKNKTEYEAFQKKKMQQQGGDKKKTHRRKSIG